MPVPRNATGNGLIPAKKSWPGESVQMRAVNALVPYPQNARTHSPEQVAQIAAAIKEWGWTVPVLVDEEDGLIAGHGRVLAAKSLGIEQVPAMVAKGWTEAQKKAYVLADNKIALNAGWEIEMLSNEITVLQGLNFDLGLVGFSNLELSDIMADRSGGLTDPDEVPATPAVPVSQAGDMWVMGGHRLLCGDSTSADDVAKLMNGVRADCVFTSPPYGVGVDYGETYQDNLENLRKMLPVLASQWLDFVAAGGFAVVNFGDIVAGRAAAGSDEPCEYPMAIEYWPPFRAAGWYLWSRRVWCKPNARVHSPWAIQSNRAASDWENVWTWKAPGQVLVKRVNGEFQSAKGWFDTTSEKGVDIGKKEHGAGMAVALPIRMLSIHSRPGKPVFEPFCGTGTTIIAAEMTGRHCYGIELNPAYVDIAVKRWENFTGHKAILDGDGRTFDEISRERAKIPA